MRAMAPTIAGLAISASAVLAAAQIPAGDLPGRERYRFVDPPGARLLQPSEPSTALPYGARRPSCDTSKGRHHRQWRKRCMPAR
jgi:hypothetical protein